jgi:hypothetical protein
MRLLNARTLKLSSFTGSDIPDYAILSHTWGEAEITFEDIAKQPLNSRAAPERQEGGFAKILGTCQRAVSHGYEWVWIDSCCIDKSSSSELQEAINSMWSWYRNAHICYAYLVDVPDRTAGWDERFSKSRWFTRGWTLQELIAPWTVEFYAADWSYIGSKLRRLAEIQTITGVSQKVLETGSTKDEMTADILSWAAHRGVSREEDEAYSLMGLFDCHMPMLYGEGGRKAFLRLQEEIFKRQPDHSLLLFTPNSDSTYVPLLADSPAQFCRPTFYRACPSNEHLPMEWQGRKPNYPLYPPRQGFGENRREELLIRRDEQGMALSILDETTPEPELFGNRSGLEKGMFLAALQVYDSSGRRPCLVLVRDPISRTIRKLTTIICIDVSCDLPEPRLVHVLCPRRHARAGRKNISLEFKGNAFVATSLILSSLFVEKESNGKQSVQAFIYDTWMCRITIRAAPHSDQRIHLEIRPHILDGEQARLVVVALGSQDSTELTRLTPHTLSCDEYELRVDECQPALISIRRLPSPSTAGKTADCYRYQIQMDLI